MDINQLRAFRAVVETGSVTLAARQLHRVPSSITTRIRQLEEEFDQTLFLRIKNRLVISPAGRRLLQHAEPLLAMFDDVERSMRDSTESEHLSLGALDVALENYLPNAIASVRERSPKARLSVRQAPSEVLRDELISGTLDAVLNDGPVDMPGIKSQYAFSERLILVTDKSIRQVTGSRDLEGVTLYGFRRNCSYRLKMEQWLQAGGLPSPTIIEMESYSVMLSCVTGRAGAAWIPETILRRMGNNRAIREHDLGDIGRTDLYFSWREGEALSLLSELIDSMAAMTHADGSE